MKIRLLSAVSVTLIAIILGLAVASIQVPVVAAESGAATRSDPMQFARGAKTWADTCARCHNMRDARSLRDDQWRAAIAHMRVRAGLTGKEAEDVLAFLQGSN
jgi:cytochrome c553